MLYPGGVNGKPVIPGIDRVKAKPLQQLLCVCEARTGFCKVKPANLTTDVHFHSSSFLDAPTAVSPLNLKVVAHFYKSRLHAVAVVSFERVA